MILLSVAVESGESAHSESYRSCKFNYSAAFLVSSHSIEREVLQLGNKHLYNSGVLCKVMKTGQWFCYTNFPGHTLCTLLHST